MLLHHPITPGTIKDSVLKIIDIVIIVLILLFCIIRPFLYQSFFYFY